MMAPNPKKMENFCLNTKFLRKFGSWNNGEIWSSLNTNDFKSPSDLRAPLRGHLHTSGYLHELKVFDFEHACLELREIEDVIYQVDQVEILFWSCIFIIHSFDLFERGPDKHLKGCLSGSDKVLNKA